MPESFGTWASGLSQYTDFMYNKLAWARDFVRCLVWWSSSTSWCWSCMGEHSQRRSAWTEYLDKNYASPQKVTVWQRVFCSWENILVSHVAPADSEQHEGAWCHWYMMILSIEIGWISLSQELCSPCLMQVQHADARSRPGRCFLFCSHLILDE